jgi:exodeoxyribonuclease VII large subunit
MELALPDINEIRIYLDSIFNTYNSSMIKILEHKTRDLNHQKELFRQNSHESKILFYQNEVKNLLQRYKNTSEQLLNQKHSILKHTQQAYEMQNPSKKDKTGFVQLSLDGKLISLDELKVDETFTLQTSKLICEAKVLNIKEQP